LYSVKHRSDAGIKIQVSFGIIVIWWAVDGKAGHNHTSNRGWKESVHKHQPTTLV